MRNYIKASTGAKNDVSFNLDNVTYTDIRYVDETKTVVESVDLYFCDGKSITIDDQSAIEVILRRPDLHFKNKVFRYNLRDEHIERVEQEISDWLQANNKDIITIAPTVYGKHSQWVAVNIFYLEQI
jgi:hypothetical protein